MALRVTTIFWLECQARCHVSLPWAVPLASASAAAASSIGSAGLSNGAESRSTNGRCQRIGFREAARKRCLVPVQRQECRERCKPSASGVARPAAGWPGERGTERGRIWTDKNSRVLYYG